MAQIMTNVELLAKHMLGTGAKSVDAIRGHGAPLLEMPRLIRILDTWRTKGWFIDSVDNKPIKVLGILGMRIKVKEIEMVCGDTLERQWNKQDRARGDDRYNH